MTNFEDLIKRVSPKLRGIAHKLNGHFTFFDDDDLYQEALGHLWLAFGRGSLNNKTDSYILQGCYFHLKNYIRKTADGAFVESMDIHTEEGGPRAESLTAKESAVQEEQDERLLRDAVRRRGLDERENKILEMSMDGLTVREIGKSLGISHVMVIKIRKRIRCKCDGLNIRGYQN